jgi:hypothetical protein
MYVHLGHVNVYCYQYYNLFLPIQSILDDNSLSTDNLNCYKRMHYETFYIMIEHHQAIK